MGQFTGYSLQFTVVVSPAATISIQFTGYSSEL